MDPTDDPFGPGWGTPAAPQGDKARQAVDALRGYAYQVLASALAWIDVGERESLFLEVAEDYAVVARDALEAVQVRDTFASGSVTLGSEKVREAISRYVDLVARNPRTSVRLRYLTTSEEGTEKRVADRPGGVPGLSYWRMAAAGADIAPLRRLLDSDAFAPDVREFVRSRDDEHLRTDLLQRIHWDCGRPDLGTLKSELRERLVIVGRDLFMMSAHDATALTNQIAFHVLRRSIVEDANARVLGRAELYELIGHAAEVVLPRTALAAILERVGSDVGRSLAHGGGDVAALVPSDPGWLVDGGEIPSPKRFVRRNELEAEVGAALASHSCAILTGATGLGKSHLARTVSARQPGGFVVADFRDADDVESRRRLDELFRRIGGMGAAQVVLEDLNHLDAPNVSLALGRVVEALRRRDRAAVVTCYEPPSCRGISDAGIDPDAIVVCRYLSEKEAGLLVASHDGDPSVWCRLAFIAGGLGHPLLVHAFVLGMSQRGWPVSEIAEVVGSGLTSGDVVAEREAARRRLVSRLPEDARTLLTRLSFLVGSFDRPTALMVGGLLEPIARVGETLDNIVGPWIERSGRDRFRLSPLATGLGQAMLTSAEQEELHVGLALHILRKRSIAASEVDALLLHSILGKWPQGVVAVFAAILGASSDNLPHIAASVAFLRYLDPTPMLDFAHPSIASMTRLAQFKLLDAAGEGKQAAEAAVSALRVAGSLDDGVRPTFEVMILCTVLATLGIANHLDVWLDWLERLGALLKAPDLGEDIRYLAEGVARANGFDPFSVFFTIGVTPLDSVERLEFVVDRLAALKRVDRDVWLAPPPEHPFDHALFVNGPWTREDKLGTLDALDAAARYRRIADKAANWDIPALSVQAWIARAVMLDEYLGHGDEALAVLEEATSILGKDPKLLRAMAKVHWRRDDYAKALALFGDLIDVLATEGPVAAAFGLREAAISSASCGDWRQAEAWFRQACAAASTSTTDDMHVMGVGLRADAGVAAVRLGNWTQGLADFAAVLEALAGLDPNAGLWAAYCHRVARHAILWMQSVADGSDVRIDGNPITMRPGGCSNPDPLPGIVDLPLAPLDVARYMLAEVEAAVGIDVGIASGLGAVLSAGRIPVMEMLVVGRRMRRAIERCDGVAFVRCLDPYVDATVHLTERRAAPGDEFDPLAPSRGDIPPADRSSGLAEPIASDAIIAFGASAAYTGRSGGLADLRARMLEALNERHSGHVLFEEAEKGVVRSHGSELMGLLLEVDEGTAMSLERFWLLSFRLFEHHEGSSFGRILFAPYEKWLRNQWRRIVEQQAFRLPQPMRTIPPIIDAMALESLGAPTAAALLSATADAAGARLVMAGREMLRARASATASNIHGAGPLPQSTGDGKMNSDPVG